MDSPLQLDEYDVIICGGGTAGCCLLNRLTEDPTLNVLMLEAGENANDDFRIYTPGLFPLLMNDPQRDWAFMGEPSPGLNGRKVAYPRGKCLGGSSAINIMAHVHPSTASLDAWAGLGNPGWDWEGVGPYYQKLQRHHQPTKEVAEALSIDYLDPALRDKNGPVSSSYPTSVEPIHKAFVDTWKELGRHFKGDVLTGTNVGGYTSTCAIDPEKGERSHAGVAYYAPIASRSNVHVVTGALVDKIEFDGVGTEEVVAKAVNFFHSGSRYTAKAKKEIVLSGGVFASPAILERSGIGSQSVCNTMGIKNIVDNPGVGENLQDHVLCGLSYEVKDGFMTADMLRDPAIIQKAMEEYQTSRSGPLAAGPGYSFAYTPLLDWITPLPQEKLSELLDKYKPADSGPMPNAESQHYAFARSIIESPHEASASLCSFNVQLAGEKTDPKELFGLNQPENYVSLLPQLAHPLSRGSVHIQDTDPNVHPKIFPNFLGHPLDTEILARHMMQAETFVKTPPFSDVLKPNGKRLPPGKDSLTLENAIDHVRYAATSNYHPCGTCAMMPRELGGVVDNHLRVYGVKGLRVCDASIFPIIVRGNIMTTVYAVAEKGSDIIKKDLSGQN